MPDGVGRRSPRLLDLQIRNLASDAFRQITQLSPDAVDLSFAGFALGVGRFEARLDQCDAVRAEHSVTEEFHNACCQNVLTDVNGPGMITWNGARRSPDLVTQRDCDQPRPLAG